MKNRLMAAILSVLMVVAVMPAAAIAAAPGDVDADGAVTASDARKALRASVGLDILTDELKKAADVDKDGSITASDARKILRCSVGLESLHTHSYVKSEIIKEATCAEPGIERLTCECGEFIEKEIPVNPENHTGETYVKDISATCSAPGEKGAVFCKGCDKLLEHGTQAPVNPEAHSYKKVTVEATCTEDGYEVMQCEYCGAEKENSKKTTAEKLGHSMKHNIVEATCTTDGYEADICERCGYYDETKVIPGEKAKGHTWGEPVIIAPTCTKDGYTRKTCTVCKAVEDGDFIEATGHNYEWTVIEKATCQKTGLKKGVCKICGEETESIIPLGVCSPVTKEVKGTCTTEGTRQSVCKDCGRELGPVFKTGFNHKTERISSESATCTKPVIQHMKCTLCGFTEDKVVGEALGHKAKIKESVPATCTTDGKIVYAGKCERCGTALDNKVIVIKATGHNPIGEVSCTKSITCSKCGEVLEPALGHDVEIKDSGLGRTVNGLICRRCGKTVENPLAAYNELVNTIKSSSYYNDHKVTTFGKTSMDTLYTRFDFGIYTAAIKGIYDDEMANTPDEYSPVRTGSIWTNVPLHTRSGYVSLLENSDIDDIDVQQLNGINMRNVLSAFPDTFTSRNNNYDISGYKAKNIAENVIKVTVDVKNEKYSEIKSFADSEMTSLQKCYDIDIRDDAKEYKEVNGELIMEESEKGPGYDISMKMKLREIASDAKIIYYFNAEDYEPICAVYDVNIKYNQAINMDFSIGLFSLNGVIDPVITTRYTTAYLFSGYFG